MKKKLLSLILTGILAFSVTACGSNTQANTDTPSTGDITATPEASLDTDSSTSTPSDSDSSVDVDTDTDSDEPLELQSLYDNFKFSEAFEKWSEGNFYTCSESLFKNYTMNTETSQYGDDCYYNLSTTCDGSVYGINTYNIDGKEYVHIYCLDYPDDDMLLTISEDDDSYIFQPLNVKSTTTMYDDYHFTYVSSEDNNGTLIDTIEASYPYFSYDDDVNDYTEGTANMTVYVERASGKPVMFVETLPDGTVTTTRIFETDNAITLPDIEIREVEVYEMADFTAQQHMHMYL